MKDAYWRWLNNRKFEVRAAHAVQLSHSTAKSNAGVHLPKTKRQRLTSQDTRELPILAAMSRSTSDVSGSMSSATTMSANVLGKRNTCDSESCDVDDEAYHMEFTESESDGGGSSRLPVCTSPTTRYALRHHALREVTEGLVRTIEEVNGSHAPPLYLLKFSI